MLELLGHDVKINFFDYIFVVSIVDRFKRSLQVCHLKFDKEAISDGWRSENAIGEEKWVQPAS